MFLPAYTEVRTPNAFKDIGLPNADEHRVKAQLVFKSDTIMKKLRMKQTEAAATFDVRQPDASNMRTESRQFPVERLPALPWPALLIR